MRSVAGRWNIPPEMAKRVIARDRACVYCGCAMIRIAKPGQSRRLVATWEHIDNDVGNVCDENICLCCMSCNSSKGARSLSEWFARDYCRKKNINAQTVADVVRRYLAAQMAPARHGA